jgi:excisionase family DNA binding protein
MAVSVGKFIDRAENEMSQAVERPRRRVARSTSGRLLDLKAAEIYSGISAWTLRDLIASGELPAVRPPRLRRVWIDRADLDKAIATWKERADR